MTEALAGSRFRLSLRLRLFTGMLAVTLVVTAGFALAIYEFVEVLEDELLHRTLVRELDGLVVDYRDDAQIAGKRGVAGRVFVVEPGESGDRLPPALQSIQPREQNGVHLDGREFYAGRRDVNGARIYFVLNVESVEALEQRLATIGWATFAGAIAVALLIALLFSRLILSPVRALASRVAALHPGEASPPIAASYSDQDIKAIAHSFDVLIERFREFIQREQAFTEDAGHELRTPLAVAMSTTELLLADADTSPRTRERAQRIHAAGVRMQRLVAALLFLASEDPRHNESCDAAAVLDEVLPYYSADIRRKQLALNVENQATRVAAPAGMVDCVLHNLIENAVEHTASGEIRIRIAPGHITIRDTGRGIDRDALQHVFDRRYRAPESRGLGIGLYLVQRICVRLGWRIDASSAPGTGTHFEITLPGRHGMPN